MGEDTVGGLTGDLLDLYSDMTFRYTLKQNLTIAMILLKEKDTEPITFGNQISEDIVFEWKDEGGGAAGSVILPTDVYLLLQKIAEDCARNYYFEKLKENPDGFKIANNVNIDEEKVIQAQGMTTLIDPLILDLNGNGIFTTTVEDGTYFDFKDDGFKEKTAWADNGDGILVYDINGNGQIDNAGELFGDRTLLANGTYARNGYEAIKQYDTDNNGEIDADDEIYNKLSVWIDADNDGITDEGELKSLTDLQVQSIGIAYTQTNITDVNGNIILGQTGVTLSDGSTLSMAAFNLQNHTTDTILKEEIRVPDY